MQTSQTCDSCASVGCSIDPTASKTTESDTNVGAIAGGVIGGVAAIAILVFIVWKYFLKGKRRPISERDWQEADVTQQEKEEIDFQSRRSARASTHTVASMASSVLTRASNIIQIAYIPGVTNRSGMGGSPDLLVPPVPPIPAMSLSSAMSSPYSASEQHFFVPDFRDSMASTSTAGRLSIAPSLAQRNSVASTMYRQNAIVSPLPAQTIVRGKAAVVSVKSFGSSSGGETPGLETPPVPQIDPKHGIKPIRIAMPGISPGNSIRSTAQLGPVRALNITKKKSLESTPPKSASGSSLSADRTLVNTPDVLVPVARPITEYSLASSDDGVAHSRARRGSLASEFDSDSDDDHARGQQSLFRNSASDRDSDFIDLQDTPVSNQSPFADSSTIEPPRPMMSQRITSDTTRDVRTPMTPIKEEFSQSKRGSAVSNLRDPSPFADSNRSNM